MQKVEDLKEIFIATHDLGVAWQNELVQLHAENFRLVEENKTLKANYKELYEENKNLQTELNNLSDKLQKMRDDIFKELNTKNSEEFQKFVTDYLKKIRECVDGATLYEKPKENPTESEDTGNFDEEERKPNFD